MYSWSVFDVINFINHLDTWIKSPIGMFITDELSHWVL